MRRIAWTATLLLLASATAWPQQRIQLLDAGVELNAARTGLQANGIFDILVEPDRVFLGTAKGLAFSDDLGVSFTTFGREDGIGRGGIAAFAVSPEIWWVSTAYDSLTSDAGELQTGGGLAWSTDEGQTWTHVPQPGPTPVQNVTFDIAIHDDGAVWITSWGGGIQRTFDRGATWQVVPPDTFLFDAFNNLNHRGFSVISADGELWVGTAAGINKSLDDGATWTNFSHTSQDEPISGNFVVALASQSWQGRTWLWAATINAVDEDEQRGVSVSDDGGFSWRTALLGSFPHNFGFDGPAAYVAADDGLYKTLDFGVSWARYPAVYDAQSDVRYLSDEFFAATSGPSGTLWAVGPDGLAKTEDDGRTWRISRGTVRPGEEGEPRTFAYPSPFSPSRHNQQGGDGHIRFQYSTRGTGSGSSVASIRIYDFSMQLVAELPPGRPRQPNGSYFEIWNGRNLRGEVVANGVYFYSVEIPGDGTFWGKFIVMD